MLNSPKKPWSSLSHEEREAFYKNMRATLRQEADSMHSGQKEKLKKESISIWKKFIDKGYGPQGPIAEWNRHNAYSWCK